MRTPARTRGRLTAGVAGLSLAAGAAAAVATAATTAATTRATNPRARRCLVPRVGKPLDAVWRPDMLAAIGYNDARRGDIAFVVRTQDRLYAYRPDHVEWSASVVKAMLMVAYLDEPWVADRELDFGDTSLLDPMITQSDDNAAEQVNGIVGERGLDGLAARVGMTHFEAVEPFWGGTHITASDQSKFLLHIDSYVVPRHRAYAMHLLASIVPSERWGVGEVAPKGWTLYFKGGWGYGTGLACPRGPTRAGSDGRRMLGWRAGGADRRSPTGRRPKSLTADGSARPRSGRPGRGPA